MTLNIERAVEIYHSTTEISNKEIKEIFGCADASARKFKMMARKEMVEQEVEVWFAKNVNTRCAFKSWGLDIADLEKRLQKLQRLSGLKSTAMIA